MNRVKLCVCIPTYNRSDAIKRVFEEELEIFRNYGIDMIICDSSENKETQVLTNEYIQKGNSHLYYQRFHSDISSNEKVFRIFQWALDSKYDYVWLIHDHTVCNEDAVRVLMRELMKGFDFYLLNMQADDHSCEIFQDVNEFLLKGAWRLNSFGASVIRTGTFLKGVDWEKMRRKYGGGLTNNYSHIGFYFERAAEMEKMIACQLYFDRKDFIDFYRTEEISWGNETLRICLECWGEVITRLPGKYTNKLEVMRTQDKWFLSKYSLLVYRKKKNYNFRIFRKYHKWIKKIYPEDYVRDFWISILPTRLLFWFYAGGLERQIVQMNRSGGQVYIFGAGRHAVECAAFFEECHLAFDGFVVTSLEGNPSELRSHPVYEAAKHLQNKKSLVVIAVLSSGISGVRNVLAALQDSGTSIKTITFAA